jgi:hypothetical protein
MTPKVLLTDTSRWALSSRVAIGLSKRGCRVSGICPNRHPLLKTRIVERAFHYNSLYPLESLTKAITVTEPHIIIPFDDRTTQHLHELYERTIQLDTTDATRIAKLIEHSLGSPGSHPIVDSRGELMRVAEEEGIRVPETCVIHTVADLESWSKGHRFPWILKAAGTWGGRGVKIAHSLAHAKKILSELASLFGTKRVIKRSIINRDPFCLRPWWNNAKPAIIVQSYIKGREANYAAVSWQGKVLAGVGVDVVNTMGPTEPASIVRVVDNAEMKFATERLVNRLGLSGFIGLDFMIEDRSQATYLIEMNPRCTPPCHIQLGKGRDMIGALCSQLSGEALQEMPPVTQNDLIAYFPQAWDSNSKFFETSYRDIPEDEPELVRELRQPWPSRSLGFRLFSYLDRLGSKAPQAQTEYTSAEINSSVCAGDKRL